MAIYLIEADVAQLLDMPVALMAVEQAHLALARGEVTDIPRQHVLQAGWPARGAMGLKVYTTSRQGVRFWVHLFDAVSGNPLAVIEANYLGMLRTGAVGGLAARALARENAEILGVIGAGWQAGGQVRALAKVRDLRRVQVFARNADALARFCAELAAELRLPVEPVGSAELAVAGADIVVTATTSPTPVLEGKWLQGGVHVNAVGSNALIRRELDEEAISRAGLICVDSVPAALNEAGDLLPALDKGCLNARQLVELGDILSGAHAGRSDSTQITLFESQGLAIQDISLAAELLDRAKSAGIGQPMPY